MRAIGDRINQFDNASITTVKEFNKLFKESPLKDYDENLEVEILDLKHALCYNVKVGNVITEHYFERRKLDESNLPDDFNPNDDITKL